MFDMTSLKLTVTFEGDIVRDYTISLVNEGAAVTGVSTEEGAFKADEIKPVNGEWTVKASSSNNAGNGISSLFTMTAKGLAWHSAYTEVSGSAVPDTQTNRLHIEVDFGKATKLSDVIMDGKKSYRAMLRLGITTTTEDASGEVLETKEVDFNEDKIREVVASFIGRLEQVPPMYSAVKVNGKKLYELAREGKEIERKSRTIEVYDIRIRQFLPPDRVEIDVDCSKGTYIRTLCADIGKALGCGGHMAELLRTATGAFSLENAIKLEELKALLQ